MKTNKKFNLIENFRTFFKLNPYMPIMSWIEQTISFADDVSSERDKPDFEMFPYQVEPIKTWEGLKGRKHVTLVSCEQMRLKRILGCLVCYTQWSITLVKALSSIQVTRSVSK